MRYNFLLTGFICLLVLTGFAQTPLQVASFNLRYDNPRDSLDAWPYRKKAVSELIQYHGFDIFGTQEGYHHQLQDILDGLPGFAYIGVGRDDGVQKGEHSAIFYNEEAFELLDSGNFWLAENTAFPNRGWDASLPRICTWGKFKDRKTGVRFYFFNVHFDHAGVVARQESAKLVLSKIAAITQMGHAVVLTGDFNVDQNDPSYQLIAESGSLADSYTLAAFRYGATGTFNGFDIHSRTDSRIDHVFVSKGISVHKHGILTDFYQPDDMGELADSGNFPSEVSLYKNENRLPSDHFPVAVTITIADP